MECLILTRFEWRFLLSSSFSQRKIQIKTEWPRAKLPIATAIVMSGCYEDDVDKLDELIYTGQGGNDLRGDRRQYRDQRVFDKSNLSLKVSDLYVYGNNAL